MTKDKQDIRTDWFGQAKFGMFIHWGLYSIPSRGEWVMLNERIPADEYNRFARKFNPRRYRPEEWVALARAAGMKYMVLTAKHHDGFALFDSRVSDFTAVKTAAGRGISSSSTSKSASCAPTTVGSTCSGTTA